MFCLKLWVPKQRQPQYHGESLRNTNFSGHTLGLLNQNSGSGASNLFQEALQVVLMQPKIGSHGFGVQKHLSVPAGVSIKGGKAIKLGIVLLAGLAHRWPLRTLPRTTCNGRVASPWAEGWGDSDQRCCLPFHAAHVSSPVDSDFI